MNIQLNQDEICNAIKEYLSNQGIDLKHKVTDVTLTAGRGSNGHSANVYIAEADTDIVVSDDDLEGIPFPEHD